MNALVTGATGFLGTAVVERLLVRGVRPVRCFVRPNSDTSRLERLAALHGGGAVELHVGNLTSSADSRRAVGGIDTVFHLAAAMRGAPATVFHSTVVASKHLLDAVVASGTKRVVLVSSLSVYGVAGVHRGQVIDENTGLEQHPEKRDVYSHAKLRQELLVREYERPGGFELIVLRPGPIYGPGGPPFSARVGLALPGLLLHFGGDNVLPLTYVMNCAEVVVQAASPAFPPGAYNVVDDDLPSAIEYLRRYSFAVGHVRSVRIPFRGAMLLSKLVETYHRYSKGQIPCVLTPYRTEVLWKGHRFDNRRLRNTGCRQLVSTSEALTRAFEDLRARRIREMPSLALAPADARP